MTNFERIKAMSVEELAGFIEGTSNCHKCGQALDWREME